VADAVSDELERSSLIRAVRQRLDSLARAGIDRVPLPPIRDEAGALPLAAMGSESLAPSDLLKSSAACPEEQTFVRAATPQGSDPPKANSHFENQDKSGGTSPSSTMRSLFDAVGFDSPPLPPEDRLPILNTLAAQVAGCRKCPHLAETRTQTVFGVGSPSTRLMFVGEAPGADEDRLGEPFVGRAGQLLTDMITKGMGLARQDVYIANVIKCRPPENRNPSPEECTNCGPYLEEQISVIRPDFLCLLGRVAVQYLLKTSLSMARLRGKWHRYRGIPTIVTYHPAYLLRNPASKKETWEDLQMLMKAMGLRVPQRGK
jgi:uracil-DNA glycosylase